MEPTLSFRCVTYDSFPDYVICENGAIIRKNGHVLKPYLNSNGYPSVSMRHENGRWKVVPVHRLVGLCFLEKDDNPDRNQINHINGQKEDFTLTNLEWCTSRENFDHAIRMGLRPKKSPVEVRDIDTGEIVTYPSIIECAKSLGLNKFNVRRKVIIGPEANWPERLQYRRLGDDRSWGEFDSASYFTREVKTGLIRLHKNLAELSRFYGFSPASATTWARLEGQPVLPGYIQIQKETELGPWRDIDVPELELAKHNKTVPVRVLDVETNTVSLFSSAKECADELGLLVTTLNERLNFSGSKPFKGKIYTRVPVI